LPATLRARPTGVSARGICGPDWHRPDVAPFLLAVPLERHVALLLDDCDPIEED
jgi:hypothetical protein